MLSVGLPALDAPHGTLDGVSAWHVLTHTSGLPDMPGDSLRHERPTYQRALRFAMRRHYPKQLKFRRSELGFQRSHDWH